MVSRASSGRPFSSSGRRRYCPLNQIIGRKSQSMGLPAHARGSLSSRMSAIFQSCQLIQQLLAACGLVHPLHHLGGGDSLRVEALAPGHRLARIAHRRLVLLVLLAFLGPALGAVLGHCCRAGVARLFGGCGPVEVVEDVVDPAKVVFGQTQPCGGPCAQDLVEAAHGNAGLCAETVAKADILPVAAGRLGLGVPGHLVDGVLQTVEVVGVQKRKIKFLTTNVHVVLLLHAYGGIACDGVADPGGRVLFSKVVERLRDADALEVGGKSRICACTAAHIAGQDERALALFALAGTKGEVEVGHHDALAGAERDLVGEQKVLKGVAHIAVALNGEGALGAALGGDRAGADVGVVRGGGVQCAAVLPHMVGTDHPVFHVGLAGLGLDGQQEVVGGLDAGIVGAGSEARQLDGFGNGHRKNSFRFSLWAGNIRAGAGAASGSCPTRRRRCSRWTSPKRAAALCDRPAGAGDAGRSGPAPTRSAAQKSRCLRSGRSGPRCSRGG
nr:MAG TPA: hypothetical protein [Caudoviricetes sp.]